ncbi:2-dehydropantoate 2-reductase N-terminal domain-containing protein [Streptomyces spiralis]|uniref:2-dehydropantoate 2-reductase N-terminal domain-containing protein n=1 Tax=Streptomyces spiralis TaxID=66376 RepID=UPI003570DA31
MTILTRKGIHRARSRHGGRGAGGCFGARLAAGGHEVRFVARGRHLKAIRERGLLVRSP